MNGSLIIGVDAGYGNYKTARRVFPTAVSASDKAPVFAKDYIELNGRYYIIGEGHKILLLYASKASAGKEGDVNGRKNME